jgi:hypothetical protein
VFQKDRLLVCPVVILCRWYSKQLQLVPISGGHIVGLNPVPVLYDDFRLKCFVQCLTKLGKVVTVLDFTFGFTKQFLLTALIGQSRSLVQALFEGLNVVDRAKEEHNTRNNFGNILAN